MGSNSSHADSKPAKAPARVVVTPSRAKEGGMQHRRQGPPWIGKRFQVKLSGVWKDYSKDEDIIMTRAFLVGHPNCRFSLRGTSYQCNFKKMTQLNLDTGKERQIRPPPGLRAPKAALLPVGPMIVLTVQKGQPGKTITVEDPNNPGQRVHVVVPATAKVGSKLAVPMPKAGEKVEDVAKRQQGHSAGAKVAMAGAAAVGVGAAAVGGFVLGDHLAGGDAATDAGEAIADGAEDAGEWVADAGEDVVDWLGDAGDAIGDFITDLF